MRVSHAYCIKMGFCGQGVSSLVGHYSCVCLVTCSDRVTELQDVLA